MTGKLRPAGKKAQQLVGLLAHEVARAQTSTMLTATPHASIYAHTRSLLQDGLVELDPADRMGLTVRLTADGFRVAFGLAQPVPADKYQRAVGALKSCVAVLAGEALVKSSLVGALEEARDVLREAAGAAPPQPAPAEPEVPAFIAACL